MMKNPHPSRSRLYVLAAALGLMMLLFLIALYDAQILHGSENRAKSIASNAPWQQVEASRGILTDRNGKVLVSNRLAYTLTFDTNGREGEYFALRVRGESMLNAGILPGDLGVVHQRPVAHNGEIVVALLGDEATVKRLSRRNGEVWLLPENEAYSPIDGREASILGKVTAVVRQY